MIEIIGQMWRIEEIGKRPKLADPLLAMVEEVGEVAQAINSEDYGKKKKLKESSAEECVDVINCAVELFFDRGGDWDLLYKKMKEKIDRWESRLDKRDQMALGRFMTDECMASPADSGSGTTNPG